MSFQDVGHRGIENVVAEVPQSSLNAVVTTGRILCGEADDGVNDDLLDARSSDRLPLVRVVPLLCNQLTMPAQDRVWCDDRSQLMECLAAK